MGNQLFKIYLLLIFILSLYFTSTVYASKQDLPFSVKLNAYGIDINQLDDIKIEAEANSSYNARIICVQYLASIGHEITPYLKDRNMKVRVAVADLLADIGRDEGLPIMIEDYNDLTSNHMDKDKETFLNLAKSITSDGSLTKALKVAKVLAKLGDLRCLELAELSLKYAPLAAQRYRAIWVLAAIMDFLKDTNNKLKSVLFANAREEKRLIVLQLMISSMGRVGGNDAIEILSVIESSSKVPEAKIFASSVIKDLIKNKPE